MNAVAGEWLAKAREDLLAVEKLADDDALTNIAAFHAQQCAEKRFKAVLENYGQEHIDFDGEMGLLRPKWRSFVLIVS